MQDFQIDTQDYLEEHEVSDEVIEAVEDHMDKLERDEFENVMREVRANNKYFNDLQEGKLNV